MVTNTVSVKAYLVNGNVAEVLEDAAPKYAIEQYFYPDSGAPVRSLEIDIVDSKGKQYSISIFPSGIEVRDIIT